MVRASAPGENVAVIKKYANRRLYNTATSSYVTLEELSAMVRAGDEFVVYDAKSGEDITRSVLTQIILEEDGKGRNLLPISFLRQIIGYYDDNLQNVVPSYLEMSMAQFVKNQDQMREAMSGAFKGFLPAPLEEMTRRNMALFEAAAQSMMNPFAEPDAARQAGDNQAPETQADDDVDKLKAELEQLKRRLDALGRRGEH